MENILPNIYNNQTHLKLIDVNIMNKLEIYKINLFKDF